MAKIQIFMADGKGWKVGGLEGWKVVIAAVGVPPTATAERGPARVTNVVGVPPTTATK